MKRKGSWWEQPEILNGLIVGVFAFLHKWHKNKSKERLTVMFTRDSNVWWVVMGGAILAVLYADPTLVSDLVSGDRERMAQGIVKLLGLVLIGGAGVARMSPLKISPEGRQAAADKRAEQMSVANQVSVMASEKADIAVAATSDAAKAADMAKDISERAAGQ